MKTSAKIEYACLAMLELAARYETGELAQVRAIADAHGIPSPFLVQILLQLKGAGLVASTRGAAGGYRLIRAPEDVTLGEVMAVLDGAEPAPVVSAKSDSPHGRVLLKAWQQIHGTEQRMLDSITLAELVEQAREQAESMYYI